MVESGEMDKLQPLLLTKEATGWISVREDTVNGCLVLSCEPLMARVLKDYLQYAKIVILETAN